MKTSGTGPIGETIDTPRHRALGSASRVAILRLVRDAAAGLTAADVAATTGQHLSTTRAHLEQLVEAGLLVKARPSGGLPGRPAWRYRAAAADPAPAPYRALATALLEHLPTDGRDMRETAVRVGRDWGRQLAAAAPEGDTPAATLATVFEGLGFSPEHPPAEPDSDSVELHLRTCPFLELVAQNPEAMCNLHAGVAQGVLEHRGVAGDRAMLEPFGAPHACVVRLFPPARRTAGDR
ncbi:helix-turn-helix domain-containing protein [Actinoplanes oblitus]|uniref:Helix-turn-helix domain-containing protein n=1 Tax=Actinoplanes oblitus TaxID=3040509 RepID=A0ABY8WSE6_9ACTN|nr:helix-turn-helix domain-containing protein [Actinoplanes oblitus]WIN00820.1 helix-turn-helix domain-containing protein [Actinoplanes oblitus]